MPSPALGVVERQPVADGPAGGALVVLVHGSMDRASSFAKVLRELNDAHVIAYDRRGYARSTRAGTPAATIAGQVDDLLGILGGRGAVVAGHSFGGDIALAAAIRVPSQIAAVVAYEPPMPWLPLWPADSAGNAALLAGQTGGPGAAAEAFMRRMVGDAVWEHLPPGTRAARRAEGPALLADMACLHPTTGEPIDPTQVRVPTVLGRGTNSRPHHRANCEHLPAVMPDAELVDVEGAGHGCHFSHPAAFAGLVRRAVSRSAGQARPGGGRSGAGGARNAPAC
jgi:pimeloyl-ACP methyl ester carboxylesterase